jgi:hypothetical protein
VVNGQARRIDQIREEDFIRAAELDVPSRRRFLELLARVGVTFAALPIATRTELAPAPPRAPAVVRYRRTDLGLFADAIDGWAAALSHDHDPAATLRAVERINAGLKAVDSSSGDVAIAIVRMRGGMLLAALQEAVYPWRTVRPQKAIATYDELEHHVFESVQSASLPSDVARVFARERARLFVRRAILLRERHQGDDCDWVLRGVLDEEMVLATQDPVVLVAYVCQKLHTKATLTASPGQREIDEWQREADRIRQRINRMRLPAPELDDLHAIVDYTLGVGWKSFMWHLHERHPDAPSPSPRIEQYARDASRYLGDLRARGEAADGARGGRALRYINVYHDSISDTLSAPELQASELDALVWCEPEMAVDRADMLLRGPLQRLPSMRAKAVSNARLASWRMGRRYDPPAEQ